MLYDQDSSMIIMQENENKLYKMDLDRGKVVEEWVNSKVTLFR
jgi:hypothetical protein